MTTDPTLWILARASGVTAYALLTAVVLVGLVVRARPFGKTIRPAVATDLHRFLGLLAFGSLAIHGTALVFDRAVDIQLVHLFVPGIAPYRPVWTGLGVIAAELMLVVYASFSQRKRIGLRAWRALHRTTYLVFALATAHGLAAGSDSGRPWAVALYGGAMGAVAAAWAWRVVVPAAPTRTRARSVPSSSS